MDCRAPTLTAGITHPPAIGWPRAQSEGRSHHSPGRIIGMVTPPTGGIVPAHAVRRRPGRLRVCATTTEAVSGWSLIAIGLFNSIMFPTSFTLASGGLGQRTAGRDLHGDCRRRHPAAAGRLGIGRRDLRIALTVPAISYALILLFGLLAGRPGVTDDPTAGGAGPSSLW